MADVSFPARLVATETTDIDGLPLLDATVTPDADAGALPLPAGPTGPAGPRGTPRTTMAKQGAIANAAGRPAGLTAEDRGKWWHRLDDDGMDLWTGSSWSHSAGAVGPVGPVADPTTIAVTTTHDPALVGAALRFTGDTAAQQLQATVPAGVRGPIGPAGASGAILTATDFDATTGPVKRSMFGLSSSGRQWQVAPPPNGHGPWGWWDTEFAANREEAIPSYTAGTFAVPALPYTWRPMCWGQMHICMENGAEARVEVRVRLNSATGVMVASGAAFRHVNAYVCTGFAPAYGDEGTKPLSPSSTYATVPAGQAAALVVCIDRIGAGVGYKIGHNRVAAALTVWAQPV